MVISHENAQLNSRALNKSLVRLANRRHTSGVMAPNNSRNPRKGILRTILLALSAAVGAAAGYFVLRFLGIPLWEHIIAPVFNFEDDLFGASISGSGLMGGILFAFSYLLSGIYFLFFVIAGGYLAVKLCLRLIDH